MAVEGRLPDFVVIGTMKSGTTTLYRWLEQRPEFVLPTLKEPNFFSDDRVWRCGLEWYTNLFAHVAPQQRTGEASVAYTDPRWAARTALRLKETISGVRLICLLRHPIERARSHYRHEVQRGRERRPLIDALAEPGNIYLARSRYAECLQPWLEAFSKEQLCVVRLEDLVTDDGSTWRRVLTHLRVDESPRPDRVVNVTADKLQFTRPMRVLWNSGLVNRVAPLPAPVRSLARRVLLRGGGRYRSRLNQSWVALPSHITSPVWADVARLPAMLSDDRLAW